VGENLFQRDDGTLLGVREDGNGRIAFLFSGQNVYERTCEDCEE